MPNPPVSGVERYQRPPIPMIETRKDAVAFLMRVHYGFFMRQSRFWYDRNLREADMLIVVRASDLRMEDDMTMV